MQDKTKLIEAKRLTLEIHSTSISNNYVENPWPVA